jgi:hypothetical protein
VPPTFWRSWGVSSSKGTPKRSCGSKAEGCVGVDVQQRGCAAKGTQGASARVTAHGGL